MGYICIHHAAGLRRIRSGLAFLSAGAESRTVPGPRGPVLIFPYSLMSPDRRLRLGIYRLAPDVNFPFQYLIFPYQLGIVNMDEGEWLRRYREDIVALEAGQVSVE